MTSPSPQVLPEGEDFELPNPADNVDETGPQDEGWYVGTCIAVMQPRPSTKPNDQGKFVLQSVFKWTLAGFPDYVQWSYLNVEGRHPKSNLHQLVLAATGMRIDRTTKLSRNFFIGLSCRLMIEKGDNGYMRVTAYKALPQPKTIAVPRPPQPAPQAPNPFSEPIDDEDDADLNNVPFD